MSGAEKTQTMIGLACWHCGSKDEYPAGSTSPCTNDCGWKVSIRADDLYACWIEIVPGLTAPTPDDTAAPDHYVLDRKYEPHLVIEDWKLNFNLGSVLKYVARFGRKEDDLKDLRKARQFLDFEIARLEGE